MVEIISRSAWGARAARSVSSTTWSQRTGFTVHYSAGPTSQTPRQIQSFHMDANGWADVGYNFLVDVAGNVYEGRGWLVVGAHAAPHNTTHIGVCFIGRDGDATPAAKRAIRALYDEANRRAGRTLSKTYHGGLSGNSTACPGAELRAWVQAGMSVDGDSDDIFGGSDLIGLKIGDKGEAVKALQRLIQYAGQSIGSSGVDGHYGAGTAEGLRKARAAVGSKATSGYGDVVSGWAYAQLIAAVVRNGAK
ncbi:N-acetylmuramoyl-L-alanine amidase [Nocardiopsis alba]|uniref:peptidoglycan recognition protein family protein n=1 Tax=Nocardiopsis alba TaxID=53437 RepID=UPI00380F6C3D